MSNEFRFREANILVGLFVLMSMVLLLLLAGFQIFFHNPLMYQAVKVLLPEEGVYALQKGAKVLIGMEPAGYVSSIDFTSDSARRLATLRIQKEFLDHYVRADSRVTLHKTFLLAGTTYINVSRGSGEKDFSTPLASTYSTLPPAPEPAADGRPRGDSVLALFSALSEAETLMKEVGKEGIPIPESLDKIFLELSRPDGLLANVNKQKELIGDVQTAVTNFSSLTVEMSEIVKEVKGDQSARADSLAKKLQEIADGMEKFLSESVETLQMSQEQLESLPSVVLQVRETLRTLNESLERFNNLPLVRRSLEEEGSSDSVDFEAVIPGGHR